MPLSATFKKLFNGRWGLAVVNDGRGHIRPGQTVIVTTPAGATTTEVIGDILGSDGQYTLTTIKSVGMNPAPLEWEARPPEPPAAAAEQAAQVAARVREVARRLGRAK